LGLWIGAPAAADLGAPLAGGRAGAFEVQVLVAPAPLRVGLSEWNVLVSAADGGPVLLDADVELALRAPAPTLPSAHGAGMHRHQDASGVLVLRPSPGTTDNGLFHGAFAELDAAGTWSATVQVRRGDATGAVTFDVAVAPAASPLRDHWRAFAIVPVGLAIFLLHQGLRLRSPRRARSVR
jgi:hypothetical protein